MLGFKVDFDDNPPVVVQPGSRFKIRGRLDVAAHVFFGIRVHYLNGDFAGKFRADKRKRYFKDNSEFEIEFKLKDFILDPCVFDRKDELANRPDGLVLGLVWSFTPTGNYTGLEITEVELLPPELKRKQKVRVDQPKPTD